MASQARWVWGVLETIPAIPHINLITLISVRSARHSQSASDEESTFPCLLSWQGQAAWPGLHAGGRHIVHKTGNAGDDGIALTRWRHQRTGLDSAIGSGDRIDQVQRRFSDGLAEIVEEIWGHARWFFLTNNWDGKMRIKIKKLFEISEILKLYKR